MSGSASPAGTSKLPWREKARRFLSSKSSLTPPPPPSLPATAPTSNAASSTTSPATLKVGLSPSLITNNSPNLTNVQLLQNALQRLNEEERATIKKHFLVTSVDIQSAVQDAVRAAKSKGRACQDKRWSVTIDGQDVVLREKADKVVHWLNRFKSVGGVVANVDPIHVGLPWAGIRLLLEATVAESNQMAALLAGCETTLYMASRLDVYVAFWQDLPVAVAQNNLEESIVVMYAYILSFLAQAVLIYETSTVRRIVSAFWKINELVEFEKTVNGLATKVDYDASNCDRMVDARGRATVLQLLQNMRQESADLQQQHYQQLQSSLDHLHIKIDLGKIPYAKGAIFNSSDGVHTLCHPATRRDILSRVQTWAQQADGKSIFWLYGGAGTGKSTISWTTAQWLTEVGSQGYVDLGASFFFKRGEGDRGSATRFFPTIVRQLITKIPGLDILVARAIESDPFVFDKALAEQFRRLIMQPLQNMNFVSARQSTLIVVVDALDECEKDIDIKTIIELWPRLTSLTGLCLRLFLTSRPELAIRIGFQQISRDILQDIDLVDAVPSSTIQHDLSVYLSDTLSSIGKDYNHRILGLSSLSNEWPSNDTIQQLVDIAVPLFIVAATMCHFVGDLEFDPRESLEEILSNRTTGQMSQMELTYLPILSHLMNKARDGKQNDRLNHEFRVVIGSIILLAEPLSVTSLATLLDVPIPLVSRRLAPLHSVLRLQADQHAPVRTLHLSFAEFLLSDKARKESFGIDGPSTHFALSRHCLRVLSGPGGLRENMCDLNYPGQSRREVAWTTIADQLSPVMQYACRYWVRHVQDSLHQLRDFDEVHTFLKKHFLHWLEALSLMDRLSEAIGLVRILQARVSAAAHGVLAFLEDARRFLLANRSIADLAPLQLYSSAIIFAPQNSLVRTICGQTPAWIQQHPDAPMQWSLELQKLEGHAGVVYEVTFSPDGSLLASGSDDCTIRLWDTQTGQEVQMIEGHSDLVTSVVFSPDGTLLASGSYDCTIRLWDMQTGQEMQILEGHSDPVMSVSFSPNSPNGALLASGSYDCTIRLWDTQTGQEVRILEGHSDLVMSVVFSPDGALLASGSHDCTIRLWDTQTGQEVRILEGHSDLVMSVVFSPDGALLASGSHDRTIRSWDTQTCQEVQILEGHSGSVYAVAFSPDGSLLVSGSGDGLIQLWDMQTRIGQEVQSLQGHPNRVWTVAVSPDSCLLASGSFDYTIRLWNLQTSEQTQERKGHSSSIKDVVFSPDGTLLASGSFDQTIRLWNTQTGQEIQTLKGHSNLVRTIAFSPDGASLASGSSDQTIRIWDTRTGREIQTLEGHSDSVRTVAFSPDDSARLASGSKDQTIRIWDTQTGQEVQTLKGHSDWIQVVAFSPDDGALLVSGSLDHTIRIWDTKSGREVQKLKNVGVPRFIRFANNNTALITDHGTFDLNCGGSGADGIKFNGDRMISVSGEWIRRGDQNLLWLPHEYRGKSTSYGDKVALGGNSGLVSIFQFQIF